MFIAETKDWCIHPPLIRRKHNTVAPSNTSRPWGHTELLYTVAVWVYHTVQLSHLHPNTSVSRRQAVPHSATPTTIHYTYKVHLWSLKVFLANLPEVLCVDEAVIVLITQAEDRLHLVDATFQSVCHFHHAIFTRRTLGLQQGHAIDPLPRSS